MKNEFLIISFVLFFAFSCHKVDNSEIVLDSKVCLGKIKSDTIYPIKIKCKNFTDHDIQLKELNITCGCIRSNLPNNTIVHSQDSGIFQFEFLPEGAGYIERVVEFYFKDSEYPYRTVISAYLK